MTENCLFCGIVAGSIPSELVAEDERVIAFMDVNPATRGHLLVVPRAHSTDLREIEPPDLTATMLMAQQMTTRVIDRLGADGANTLTCTGAEAWQSVFHTHVHVIPRYKDDPLRLPWQPRSGDSDAIAEAASVLR
jgi:histidine triad (HIT) family protein